MEDLNSGQDSSIASSMESLTLDSSDHNLTPCKPSSAQANPVSTGGGSSASNSASRRKNTNLSSIKSLPPLRPASAANSPSTLSSLDPRSTAVSAKEKEPVGVASPERPAWDSSFVRKEFTPSRLPWSADIRARKADTSLEAGSPRTPHNSQINVKRQKQKSQLSRPSLVPSSSNKNQSGNAEHFAVPRLPTSKSGLVSTAKVETVDYQEQILNLRQELELERKAKASLELKYQSECKARVKIEMEYNMLLKKLENLGTKQRATEDQERQEMQQTI